MISDGLIVGFYFAEDRLIHRGFDLSSGRFLEVDKSLVAIPNGEGSVRKAASIIKEFYIDRLGRPVVGVGLAVPTSILELDQHSDRYGTLGGQLAPIGWKNFNAKQTLLDELSSCGVSLAEPEKIGIISQVGATAKGHFKQHFGTPASKPSHPLKNDKRSYLYIVADEGIGAASYNSGWLLHGSAVPNIGHSMVIPIDGDIPKTCKFHPRRPCLNAYASLDAIYARHPEILELPNKFIDCNDHSIISGVAHYIAQTVSNLVLFMSPQKIILGGRIADNPYFLGHFIENLSLLLENDEEFDELSYPQLKDFWSMVEHQGDKDFGVNGAVWTAYEFVDRAGDITNLDRQQ